MIREFERILDLPRSLCERIVNDPFGEPIVVAAVAARIPIAVVQRILLLVNPAVSHSVERVFDLTNLDYELDRRAADQADVAVARNGAAARPFAARGPAGRGRGAAAAPPAAGAVRRTGRAHPGAQRHFTI